jgi:2-desacetyl-2-hydroxyethyl bacteriochlorophyllide A dehydrogenase
MRALINSAPSQVEIRDWPRPQPAAGDAEIAVSAAGICTVDISRFLGHNRHHIPPMILGHELVGHTSDGRRVVADPLISCGHCAECRADAGNLCSGLRLLGLEGTPGCHAEFVTVAESNVYEIPPGLSDAQAVLAEPLANIVHMFRRTMLPPFFSMGIVGAGTMGSLALKMALHLGVREVLVEDVDEIRLAAARHMGATLAVNPRALPGEARSAAGRGMDLVLDASGEADARQWTFDLCKPGGTVVLLGMAQGRSEIDFATSIRKEHKVLMSFGYTPVDFRRSLDLLVKGEIDMTPWSAEMPLEDGQKAFEKMSYSRGETLKMLLRVR